MRSTSFLLVLFITVSNLAAQTKAAQEYYLLIGTYGIEGKPNGIHVYRFNTESGEFNMAQSVTELPNASYVAISGDRQNVYAISDGAGGGRANAFAFNPVSGALTFMNSVPARGPAY